MRKRFVLLTTDNAELTLGEGRKRFYTTLVEAACALAHDDAPYATILGGDGDHARELTTREQTRVDRILADHGAEMVALPNA